MVITVFGIEAYKPNLIPQEWATVRLCGYCKAAITLVKYAPQAVLNFRRKSTVGFSVTNVLLDFLGGLTSFGQLYVDAVVRGESLFGGGDDTGFNIVKFLLSILTIVYDSIFLF